MKKSKQFWIVMVFLVLSLAPFVPVAKNMIKIRGAVLFDDSINWKEGLEIKYKIPHLDAGRYELRMESAVSDWQPVVQVSLGIRDLQNGREVMPMTSPTEVALTRPLAKIQVAEPTSNENELTLIFANSSPAEHALRIKLSRDRDSLLEESAREFGIVLAVSLALMFFMWKPFASSTRPVT